ncbi:MAG TPA: acyloxyacyl hydrolase [Candidatus Saccharimonadales bacterium]|nr:acyloxyacyl hydrolase [Candidatus Saccharimonadales bacterium]
MKTAFERNSPRKSRLFIPVSKFVFAAYPVQVHQSLRLLSMTGRPQTTPESGKGTGLRRMMKFAVTVLLLSLAFHSDAQNYLAGVRGGTSFEKDAGNFQQVDVFAGRYLPWLWGGTNGLNIKPRWEASAGCLHNEGKEAAVGTTGPVFEMRIKNFPLTVEGGVSLSALSRSDFPDRDLGGWFEFTDHAGINWHINKQFTVGWRYQHMSNAGIYAKNPGLNLQMLSATYNF